MLNRTGAHAESHNLSRGIQTKAARRPWNPALHPRDSRGRFVETGGIARLWGGTLARVVRALPHDRVLVQDRVSDGTYTGRRHTTSAKWITMVARPDGSAPTNNENKVAAEDERRHNDPHRGNGVAGDDDGDPATPDKPHDVDDEGKPIGDDEGSGPDPDDDQDEPANRAHPVKLEALPNQKAGPNARFTDTAAVRRHLLSIAAKPDTDPEMAAALRQVATDEKLRITPSAGLAVRRDPDTSRFYLTATGTGHRIDEAGQFGTSQEAERFARLLDETVGGGEGNRGFDFSDPNLAAAAQSWRSARGEDVQGVIVRTRADFAAAPAAKKTAPPRKTTPAQPKGTARFATLAAVRAHWTDLRGRGGVPPEDAARLDALVADRRLKLAGSGQFVIVKSPDGTYQLVATGSGRPVGSPVPRQRDAQDLAEQVAGSSLRGRDGQPLDLSDPVVSVTDWRSDRDQSLAEVIDGLRGSARQDGTERAAAAGEVERGDLQPGDQITVTVGRGDLVWPDSTRSQKKPERVTVQGTIAPSFRPGSGPGGAPLIDVSLTDENGREIASGETVHVTRMPARAAVAERLDGFMPEEMRADRVRVGDVIARGTFGHVVTRVDRSPNSRSFTTRSLGSDGAIDGFGTRHNDMLNVVPRGRRRPQDVQRDLPNRDQQHIDSNDAKRAAATILQDWAKANALAEQAWPDGAPKHFRDLARQMQDVSETPRGADGYQNNAQAMSGALAALDALETDGLDPKLLTALHRLEDNLDRHAEKFAADARAITSNKHKRSAEELQARPPVTELDNDQLGSEYDELTTSDFRSMPPDVQRQFETRLDDIKRERRERARNAITSRPAPETLATDQLRDELTELARARTSYEPDDVAEARKERIAAVETELKRRQDDDAAPAKDTTVTPEDMSDLLDPVRPGGSKAPSSMDNGEIRDEIVSLMEREMANGGELTGVDRTRMRVLEAEEARRAGRTPKREASPKQPTPDPDGLFDADQDGPQMFSDPVNPMDRPDDEFGTPDMVAAAEGRDTSKLRPVQTRMPQNLQPGDRFVDADGRTHTVTEAPLSTGRGRVRVISDDGQEHHLPAEIEVRVLHPDEAAPQVPAADPPADDAPATEIPDSPSAGRPADAGSSPAPGEVSPAGQPNRDSDPGGMDAREPADMSTDELANEIDGLEDVTAALQASTDPLELAYRLRAERRLWALQREEGDRWEREPQYDAQGNLVEPSRGSILLDRVGGYGLNQDEARGAVSSVDDLPPAKPGAYSDAEWEKIETEASEAETYPPTDEQRVIIEGAARRGLDMRVMALAGTGKSTTLKMLSRRMPGKRILYLAFNRSVADEAIESQQRGEYANNLTPTTANAYANSMVDRALLDRLKWQLLNDQQLADRMRWYTPIPAGGDSLSPRRAAYYANKLLAEWVKSDDVDFAEHHLPESLSNRAAVFEAVKPLAAQMWANITDPKANDRDRDLPLSFDHTVKMWALSGRVPDTDVLFWDEAQDVNPVMEGIVRNIRAAGIQVVAVGDSNQAIYGFRGATDALGRLPADATATLTQTFRFGGPIADAGNRFLRLVGTRMRLKGWDRKDSRIGEIQPGDETMLIARTNAGVVLGAVEGLQAGRKVAVSGGLNDLRKFLEAAEALRDGKRTKHQELARFNGMDWDTIREEVAADKDLKQLDSMFKLMERHSDALDALLDAVRMPRPLVEDDGEHLWIKLAFGDRNFDATKAWLKRQGFGYDGVSKRWGYPPPKKGGHVPEGERAKVLQKVEQYLAEAYAAPASSSGGQIVDQAAPHDLLVSTAHKAKGLESKRVRIAGDFFTPKETSEGGIDWDTIPNDEDLRLAYVAVTRATDILDMGSLGWVLDATRSDDPLVEPDGVYTRDWEISDFQAGNDITFWSEDGESLTPGTVSAIDGVELRVRTQDGRTTVVTPSRVARREGQEEPRLPVASPEELDAALRGGQFVPPQPGGTVRLSQQEVRDTLTRIRPEPAEGQADGGSDGSGGADETSTARMVADRLPELPPLPKMASLSRQQKDDVRRIRGDYGKIQASLDGILAGDPPTGDAREDLRRVREQLDYVAHRLTRDLLPDSDEAQTVRGTLIDLGPDLDRALAALPNRDPQPQGEGPNGGTLFHPWDLQDGDLVRFEAENPADRAGGHAPYFGFFRGASSASGEHGRTLVTYQGRRWNDDRQQWEPDLSQYTVTMPPRGLVERFTEEEWDAWRRPERPAPVGTPADTSHDEPAVPPAPIGDGPLADMTDDDIIAELEALQQWQDRHAARSGEGPLLPRNEVWAAVSSLGNRRGELHEEQRKRSIARSKRERQEKEAREKAEALGRARLGKADGDGYPVSVDGQPIGSVQQFRGKWSYTHADGGESGFVHKNRGDAVAALVRGDDWRRERDAENVRAEEARTQTPDGWVHGDRDQVAENDIIRLPRTRKAPNGRHYPDGWREPVRVREVNRNSNGSMSISVANLDGSVDPFSTVYLGPDDVGFVWAQDRTPPEPTPAWHNELRARMADIGDDIAILRRLEGLQDPERIRKLGELIRNVEDHKSTDLQSDLRAIRDEAAWLEAQFEDANLDLPYETRSRKSWARAARMKAERALEYPAFRDTAGSTGEPAAAPGPSGSFEDRRARVASLLGEASNAVGGDSLPEIQEVRTRVDHAGNADDPDAELHAAAERLEALADVYELGGPQGEHAAALFRQAARSARGGQNDDADEPRNQGGDAETPAPTTTQETSAPAALPDDLTDLLDEELAAAWGHGLSDADQQRVIAEVDRRDDADRKIREAIPDTPPADAAEAARRAQVMDTALGFAGTDIVRPARTREQQLRDEFMDIDEARYQAAVDATNGYFFRRQHMASGLDERELFSGGTMSAFGRWEQYASEELREWFDANGGRLTFNQFKQQRRADDRRAREEYEEETRREETSTPETGTDQTPAPAASEAPLPADTAAGSPDTIEAALAAVADRYEEMLKTAEEAWGDEAGQNLGKALEHYRLAQEALAHGDRNRAALKLYEAYEWASGREDAIRRQHNPESTQAPRDKMRQFFIAAHNAAHLIAVTPQPGERWTTFGALQQGDVIRRPRHPGYSVVTATSSERGLGDRIDQDTWQLDDQGGGNLRPHPDLLVLRSDDAALISKGRKVMAKQEAFMRAAAGTPAPAPGDDNEHPAMPSVVSNGQAVPVSSLTAGDSVEIRGRNTRGVEVTRQGQLLATPRADTGRIDGATAPVWRLHVGAEGEQPRPGNLVTVPREATADSTSVDPTSPNNTVTPPQPARGRDEDAPYAAGEPDPQPEPDPVNGQPAHWARVGDLVPGDMVRIEGTTTGGRAVARPGYVYVPPVQVEVTRSGRTESMWRTYVTEHADGTGQRGNVFTPLTATAARAEAPENTTAGSPVTGAQSNVLTGELPDTIPTDRSGRGLFPGSTVTDRAGREGIVTGATDSTVAVRWSDGNTDEGSSPTSLTATTSERPAGWTAAGQRVRPGYFVTDENGGTRGSVDAVDGDRITVMTGEGTVIRSAAGLRVVGEVRDVPSADTSVVNAVSHPTAADLGDSDIAILDFDGVPHTVQVIGKPNRDGDRVTLEFVDTTTGELGEIELDATAVVPRAEGPKGPPQVGGPAPAPREELIVHEPRAAITPVTGPAIHPELTPADRDAIEDHGTAPEDEPDAQQAAARIRQDLPVTREQATALAAQLRASADPSTAAGRAALRAAEHLDRGVDRTPPTGLDRPRPSNAAQLTVGDTVAMADERRGDTIRVYRVIDIDEGSDGIRSLLLEGDDQQWRRRVVHGAMPVWQLPEARPDAPQPPDSDAGDEPGPTAGAAPAQAPVARVRPGGLRAGDVIDAPVSRAGYRLNGHRRLTLLAPPHRNGWWMALTGVDEDGNVHDFGLHAGREVNVYERNQPTPATAPVDAPGDPNPSAQSIADQVVAGHARTVAARIITEAIVGTEQPGDIHALREQIAQRLTPAALQEARRAARREAREALTAAGITGRDRANAMEALKRVRQDAHTQTVRAALRTINDLEPLPDESHEDLARRAADLLRLIPDRIGTASAPSTAEDRDIEQAATGHATAAIAALMRELQDAGLDAGDAETVGRLLAGHLSGSRQTTARRIAARAGGRTTQPGLLTQIGALLMAVGRRLVALVKAVVEKIAEGWRNNRDRLARLRAFLGRLAHRVRQWPETRRLARLQAALDLPSPDVDSLSIRVAHWARLMPEAGRFGQTSRRVTWWRPATWGQLAAGRLPDRSDRLQWSPDRAADGGPGLTALRHLAVVRAAGSDVDQDVTRRLAAELGDDFGDDPNGTLRYADAYVASTERRLVNLRAARTASTIQDPEVEVEITAAQLEAATARREWAELRARYAAAVPTAVAAALSEIREIGPEGSAGLVFTPQSTPNAERALRGVQSLIPRSWLRVSAARRITAVDGDHGRYEPGAQRATIADLADDGLGTAGHALAQHLAQRLGDLDAAQRAFWFTRTHTGRPGARRMNRSALSRLLSRQQTQTDTGDTLARAVQSMFSGDWYMDDDLRAFLLGLLATR